MDTLPEPQRDEEQRKLPDLDHSAICTVCRIKGVFMEGHGPEEDSTTFWDNPHCEDGRWVHDPDCKCRVGHSKSW